MADEDDFVMQVIPASSRLSEWGYKTSTSQARAVFPSGRIAVYSDVPYEVYSAVLNSASVGSAFGAMIVNGGYAFEYES